MSRKACVAGLIGLLTVGCVTGQEMRQRPPDFVTARGIPIEAQEAMARCIEVRTRKAIGPYGLPWAISQDTQQESDGWHVVASGPVTTMWAVAVRADAVEVFFASAPIMPRGAVKSAVEACTAQELVAR